ncbi:acyltransferase family protein [Microvirga sp. Mcv34]|uniref:acyltransferase family protein n=1 Tax=Microvirga sp. Mcv34 TaxID=2926016 RepID=UPI0021C9D086|nr:acyltransferase [Microvirga sp. Mcv34]
MDGSGYSIQSDRIRGTMTVADVLKRENNNFNLARLILAVSVIVGHAYALAPSHRKDIIGVLLGFDYSGSLAVKGFFFLSGLLVANSLLVRADAAEYVKARAFRIFPALTVNVLFCALLLGPIVTALPLQEYLSSPGTFRFIYDNVTLSLSYRLPGVFDDVPYKGAVNGSLWTLPYEVACYLVLLGAYLCGLMRSRYIIAALCVAVIADGFFLKVLFSWSKNTQISTLPACFALGVLAACFKERITVQSSALIGLVILAYFGWASPAKVPLFYLAFFYGLLVFSSQGFVRALVLKWDVSYGVYLYGFPVQQALKWAFPSMGTRENMLAAIPIALALGLASWLWVEKPAMRLSKAKFRRTAMRVGA